MIAILDFVIRIFLSKIPPATNDTILRSIGCRSRDGENGPKRNRKAEILQSELGVAKVLLASIFIQLRPLSYITNPIGMLFQCLFCAFFMPAFAFYSSLLIYYGEHIIVCIEHNKEGCTRLMRSFLMWLAGGRRTFHDLSAGETAAPDLSGECGGARLPRR